MRPSRGTPSDGRGSPRGDGLVRIRARVFSNQRSSAGTTTDRTRPVETFAGLGRDRPVVSPALARSSVRKRPRLALVSRSSRAHPPSPRPRLDISSLAFVRKNASLNPGKTRSVARAARRTRCVSTRPPMRTRTLRTRSSTTRSSSSGASLSNLARCPRRASRRRRTRRRRSCRRSAASGGGGSRRRPPGGRGGGPRAVPGPLARRRELVIATLRATLPEERRPAGRRRGEDGDADAFVFVQDLMLFLFAQTFARRARSRSCARAAASSRRARSFSGARARTAAKVPTPSARSPSARPRDRRRGGARGARARGRAAPGSTGRSQRMRKPRVGASPDPPCTRCSPRTTSTPRAGWSWRTPRRSARGARGGASSSSPPPRRTGWGTCSGWWSRLARRSLLV